MFASTFSTPHWLILIVGLAVGLAAVVTLIVVGVSRRTKRKQEGEA